MWREDVPLIIVPIGERESVMFILINQTFMHVKRSDVYLLKLISGAVGSSGGGFRDPPIYAVGLGIFPIAPTECRFRTFHHLHGISPPK